MLHRRAAVLAFGAITFFALGLVLVLLGVSQAEMARSLSMDLSAYGFLGAMQSLGLGVGVTAAGPLADRVARKPLLVGACLLPGLALLSVEQNMSYLRAVASVTVVGVGCGCYITVLNAATFDRFGARTAPALAAMHASATAGASLGPLLIAWCSAGGAWSSAFHALGALHLALAGWAGVVTLSNTHAAAAAALDSPRARSTFRSLLVLELFALATIGFAYVGVENGLTLFAVPWAKASGQTAAVGRIGISAFWLGLLAGRLTVAAQRRSPGASLLMLCGLVAAAVIGCASGWASTPIVLALGAAGLALGPVYPVMIALTTRRFPHAVGTACGLVGGAGACGGLALPWLSGVIGDAFGLRIAVGLLGACALAIAFGALVLARHEGKAVGAAGGARTI